MRRLGSRAADTKILAGHERGDSGELGRGGFDPVLRNSIHKTSLRSIRLVSFGPGQNPILGRRLIRNSHCKSLVGLESCFFPSGPKLVLVGRLLSNILC
jgi:hypothetical protein